MKIAAVTLALFLAFAGRHVNAESPPLIAGLAYSPSHLRISYDEPVSEDRIRRDLEILAKVTNRVRTYSVDGTMARVPAIAQKLGMKVSLGIWLGPDRKMNDLQIARALKIISAHATVIDRVFVGNETLLRGDLTLEELRGYLRTVRQGVHTSAIQVTTGETWGFWQKFPTLAEDCDVIGAHILPYWDKYRADEAIAGIKEQAAQLGHLFPGKQIVIAETGWPSRGETRGAAIPSPETQESFVRDFVTSPAAQAHDYYIVEAFDQPWKARYEGDVGTGWGMFDVDGKPKLNLIPRAKSPPAGSTATDSAP